MAQNSEDILSQEEIEQHFAKQKALKDELTHTDQNLQETYEAGDEFKQLKADLKAQFKKKLSVLPEGKKHAILLVDIQNDFILPQFALVPDGFQRQRTVYHNMALLDAIDELVEADPSIAKKLEIVTSQDAHVLNREANTADADLLSKKSKINKDALPREKQELKKFNPAKGQFGAHCIVGTVGADIITGIENRVEQLRATRSIAVTRFVKVTFDGTETGMKLKEGVKLSQVTAESIIDENGLTYLEFFASKKFAEIFITGIAGEVCVQQAAHGLRKALSSTFITVIEACTHYLNVANNQGIAIEKSYRQAGIGLMKMMSGAASNAYDGGRMNIDAEGNIRLVANEKMPANISAMFAFCLRHPKACVAVLDIIAFAAVALAAYAAGVMTVTVAAAVAAVAVSATVASMFYTRPAANHTMVPKEDLSAGMGMKK